MASPETGEKKDFADRVATNMSMSKREVLDAFQAQFPQSSEAAILAAFVNLRNAPDDATITFTRRDNRGRDSLYGEIKDAGGNVIPGGLLVSATTGQPLQRIG